MHGVLHTLIDVLNEALTKKDQALIKQGTWALANFCKGKPPTGATDDATAVFCTVVKEVTDMEILREAIWAHNDLSNADETLETILGADIIHILMRYLE